MKNLTLVIPAKEEEESLPLVLEEIKNLECKKIVVIPKNDLNTQKAIENFNCKIVLQEDQGFGGALIKGINQVDTDLLCLFNSDGSFNPVYLKKMYEMSSNEHDFVFSSRYEKDGGSDDDTFLTLLGNKIFTFICNVLFRLNLSDVLFTYVMGKTSAFKLLELKSKDFSICV